MREQAFYQYHERVLYQGYILATTNSRLTIFCSYLSMYSGKSKGCDQYIPKEVKLFLWN